MLFSFGWLCRAAQGHNPSWRGARAQPKLARRTRALPKVGGTRALPKVNGAQERYPRRAAQRRSYCVYYIILPFEIPLLFCENAPVFRRPSGQKKKARPRPVPHRFGAAVGGKPGFAESPREASRHAGAFPQKRPSRPRKKIALAQEKSTPRPSEQARPNKCFSPTQKAAPKPFRIWEQPCLFICFCVYQKSSWLTTLSLTVTVYFATTPSLHFFRLSLYKSSLQCTRQASAPCAT